MNIRKIALLFACFILLTHCSQDDDQSGVSQFLGEMDWVKSLGGTNEDIAKSILQTQNGDLLILGTTASINGDIIDKTSEENDYWLTKTDIQGNLIWSKTYGGSDDDVGQKVIELSDGNLVLVGYSKSSDGDASNNEGFHDNWIIKLDANGNFLWEKSFGFAGHDHAYTILETSDGGLFMAGFLDVTASGGQGTTRSVNRHGVGEFWCHKLDANGNIEWRKYYGGTNNDRAYDAVQSADGGFVVTGFSESDDFDISAAQGSYDYWVIKIDSSGNLIWEKSLGGSEIDQSRSIVRSTDNGYLVLGNSFSTDGNISTNYGGSDFMITKLSDDGTVMWTKNYGGSNFDFGTSIRTTQQGYLVSGYSQSSDNHLTTNNGNNDFWLFLIDENGNLVWQKSFGGSGLDFAHDAIQLNDGTLVIVGETESNDGDITQNNGLKDALIIKVK